MIEKRDVQQVETLGFIGRLEPAKGLPIILRALEFAPAAMYKLVVAGTGRSEQVEELEHTVRRDSRITYLGRVDAPKFYSLVDAVVIPTQWEEPFGRIAVEAMAANLPIVASNVGALPEVLEGYEPVVFVDHFASPAAWAHAIDRMSTSARNNPTEGYPASGSTSSLAEHYVSAFEEAVNVAYS